MAQRPKIKRKPMGAQYFFAHHPPIFVHLRAGSMGTICGHPPPEAISSHSPTQSFLKGLILDFGFFHPYQSQNNLEPPQKKSPSSYTSHPSNNTLHPSKLFPPTAFSFLHFSHIFSASVPPKHHQPSTRHHFSSLSVKILTLSDPSISCAPAKMS